MGDPGESRYQYKHTKRGDSDGRMESREVVCCYLMSEGMESIAGVVEKWESLGRRWAARDGDSRGIRGCSSRVNLSNLIKRPLMSNAATRRSNQTYHGVRTACIYWRSRWIGWSNLSFDFPFEAVCVPVGVDGPATGDSYS